MTESLLRQFSGRPRAVMWSCLMAVSLLAWGAVASMSGPRALVEALCSADGPASPMLVLAMWLAMSLAMMLPTAAPMISVYMDIAEAAREKSLAVAPPMLLALGHATVWIGFSVAAAGLQVAVVPPRLLPGATGMLLIAVGLYQFTPLKRACLTKCRYPMPYFMAKWSDRPGDVFRMGLSQGASCLGCCWALMLLAFAAGAMNLVWMAGMAVLMMLEKCLPQPKAMIHGLGLGLIGAGAVINLM